MDAVCTHSFLSQLIVRIVIVSNHHQVSLFGIQYLESLDQISQPFKGTTFRSTDIDTLKSILGNSIRDRKSTRLNSSHANISYAVFCLKKKQTYAWRRSSYSSRQSETIIE